VASDPEAAAVDAAGQYVTEVSNHGVRMAGEEYQAAHKVLKTIKDATSTEFRRLRKSE
jgi:hypothetical protein